MFKFQKILITIFFLIFSFDSLSVESDKIIITGNKRITKNTILNYASFKGNIDHNNLDFLNSIQKKLYSTGFFSSVEIKYFENKILINIKENPFIKFFYVDGIPDSEFNELQKSFLNKENSFFSENNLKVDTNTIIEFYKLRGFFNANVKIDYNILDDNSINLIYNIKKNKVSKIKNIEFIGNKNFSKYNLLSEINSSIDGWWKFLSSTTKVNSEILNYDTSLLKKYYNDRGYYDFQVISAYYEKQTDYSVKLVFSLFEGEKYNFDNFKINVLEFPLSKNIEKEIYDLGKKILSSSYSSKKILKFRKKLDEILLYNNYLDISYKLLDKKNINNTIDISLIFSKINNFYQIKSISVTGNDITKESVIRRNLYFQEGDIFNQKNLTKSLSKLKNLNIFKDVKIDRVISDNFIDLKISVIEMPTGEISAGAGAGTNGAMINAGIQEKNFLGNGNKLSGFINLGTDKVEGNVSYTNNDFNRSGQSVTSSVFATKYDYADTSGFENSVYGTRLSTKYEIFEDFFFSPGVSIEFDSFNSDSTASSLIKKRDGDYWSSKLFYNISNDKRNSAANPTEGYEIGFGQTLSTLISDLPSIKNTIYGSYYQEIIPKFNGSIKYRLRSINSINNDDVMFSERLHFTDQVLRGFKSRGVGPKDGNDHVGGNYSINTTIATTVPSFLPETWNTTTGFFLDAANLWGVDFSDTIDESNSLRMSVGVGLNWLSPLGPISVTYSSPLAKKSTDEVREFSFNLGTVF